MSDMSTYTGDALINWMRNNAMPAQFAAYVGLYDGDPDSGGTEITGTISLTRQLAGLSAPAARASANAAEIDFGDASGSATVSYVTLHTASTAGNRIAKKAVASVGVDSGEKVAIATGDLDVSY